MKINLILNGMDEARVVFAALQEVPFKLSAPLINRLQLSVAAAEMQERDNTKAAQAATPAAAAQVATNPPEPSSKVPEPETPTALKQGAVAGGEDQSQSTVSDINAARKPRTVRQTSQ